MRLSGGFRRRGFTEGPSDIPRSEPEPEAADQGDAEQYEKRHGVWKFSHRAVLADWANLHDPSIVNLENPIMALSGVLSS